MQHKHKQFIHESKRREKEMLKLKERLNQVGYSFCLLPFIIFMTSIWFFLSTHINVSLSFSLPMNIVPRLANIETKIHISSKRYFLRLLVDSLEEQFYALHDAKEETRKFDFWVPTPKSTCLGILIKNHYIWHISARSNVLGLVETLQEAKFYILYDEKKKNKKICFWGPIPK